MPGAGPGNARLRPEVHNRQRWSVPVGFDIDAADEPGTFQQRIDVVTPPPFCGGYENLDPVLEAEEAFKPGTIANDRIERTENA